MQNVGGYRWIKETTGRSDRMNSANNHSKGEKPDDSKKVYHKSDGIATEMYGGTRSNAQHAGMALCPVYGGGSLQLRRSREKYALPQSQRLPLRIPAPEAGYPYGYDVSHDSKAPQPRVCSFLRHRAQTQRNGTDSGCSGGVRSRRVHPENGKAGAEPGNRKPLPQSGQRDDKGPQRVGTGVSHPFSRGFPLSGALDGCPV